METQFEYDFGKDNTPNKWFWIGIVCVVVIWAGYIAYNHTLLFEPIKELLK